MNKEEILYNEIYERTKDFGRTHFIKEIMRLQKELEQLKEIEKEHQRINGRLHLEIKELKEQYNDLVEEKEKLQEQLSINTLQLEEMKLSKRDYTQENILTMKLTLKENQQKEFIEYLENMLDDENDIFSVVRVKDVLQKYKEIIGGKK